MGMKVNIETGELVIEEKYVVKPLMTVEEIKKSNLIELMDEENRGWLENRPSHPIAIFIDVNGEEVKVEFEIIGGELVIINIVVDPKGISEAYYSGDEGKFGNIVSKNLLFMVELFKDNKNNRYRFSWGKAEFNNGNRTYNVKIEIQYFWNEVI
ncbi:hypothetical protein NNC19_21795 [Clostridium sp. SHJSY1]|uniref:hypothetical protein n=1 Tax=Clostridium sp. SHJSY1 TaxID=2942483 RepID=UPI00287499A6|nr:hypothetical protein [Clostridium sp. SHJSY1]MDS0528324.1 hypothetical protein [Clostridium sp. SHJSY1]